MKDLDVVAFGVFGSEGPPGPHIGDFAKNLNGLRFPLLVDRVGILDFKTRNDAAMRHRSLSWRLARQYLSPRRESGAEQIRPRKTPVSLPNPGSPYRTL